MDKIKVSGQTPAQIHTKDFDNNGTIDPIVSFYINGENAPMLPKDDLIGQLRSLKKKFVYYEDYAKATVKDFFTERELADAHQLEATMFATSYVENKGNGNFQIKELPLPAQFSPIYSILLKDLNRDGHKDILLGGNLMETRVQFGRYDASKGSLLLGDGSGNFQSVPQIQSGLNIKGAVRDMATIENNDKEYIIIAKNNGPLQVLRQKK